MTDIKPQKTSTLNCIVDESALLAGLRESSQDNLRQWVNDGAINLFVPLSTLDKLNSLRRSLPPTNLEARNTLEWLDDITSMTAAKLAGRVELQGPDDQYQDWRDVEKYLLPDTPLSSGMDNLDGLAKDMKERLNLRKSPRYGATALRDASDSSGEGSPRSSPELVGAASHRDKGIQHNRTASKKFSTKVSSPANPGGIPTAVQPLLNYVVWRTYNGDKALAGSSKYILLTNDRIMQRQALKFGVRAKMLSQLTTIIGKMGLPKENGHVGNDIESGLPMKEIEPKEAVDADPDEEIVFNPAQRPTSSRGIPAAANVIDPDHFGRENGVTQVTAQAPTTSPSQNSPKSAYRGNNHRGSSGHGNSRGQNGSTRGRGHFHSRGGNSTRGNGPTSRGQFQGHGRFNQIVPESAPQQQITKPIDPDSFTRPSPVTRGRGSGRRLWNPNT